MAYIGGISKGLGILLLVVVYPFREILFYKKCINHMFNVCLDERQIHSAVELVKDTKSKTQLKDGITASGVRSNKKRRPTMKDLDDLKNFINPNKNKKKTKIGLMDEIQQLSMKQKDVMENMMKFVKKKKSGRTKSSVLKLRSLGEILKAGLGRQKTIDRNVIDESKVLTNFTNGVMNKLSYKEIMVLEKESVKKGLKLWLQKVQYRKMTIRIQDLNQELLSESAEESPTNKQVNRKKFKNTMDSIPDENGSPN